MAAGGGGLLGALVRDRGTMRGGVAMTNPVPFAPDGIAADLAAGHRRLTAWLHESGASCLGATRDQTVTYLTGYTSTTWKTHNRPVLAVLAADGRLSIVVAETEADSARLRIPGA